MGFSETFEMQHTKKQDQLHLTNYSQDLFLYNRDTKCNMLRKNARTVRKFLSDVYVCSLQLPVGIALVISLLLVDIALEESE